MRGPGNRLAGGVVMSKQAICVSSMMAVALLAAGSAGALAQTPPRPASGPPTVTSPDGRLVVTIGTEGQLTWSVSLRGRVVLAPSRIAMTLGDGRVLGEKPLLTTTFTRSIDTTLRPVVRYRRAEIRDRFNEAAFAFAGNFALVVRAYDDGVAYRWKTTPARRTHGRRRRRLPDVHRGSPRLLPRGNKPALPPGTPGTNG